VHSARSQPTVHTLSVTQSALAIGRPLALDHMYPDELLVSSRHTSLYCRVLACCPAGKSLTSGRRGGQAHARLAIQ
jgi:hypothetical protein